jgi:hypothetical protein
MEEQGQSDNKVLRIIFGPKREIPLCGDGGKE